MLLTGREQSERHEIRSTAGHQKTMKADLREFNLQNKRWKMHLSRRDSTEKRGKGEGKQKKQQVEQD